MNKDVIYIDVEDDITAIIGKIKASKERIVALVPPKRIGVLQSAVNLKLLARIAENSHKRLVIVTNNKALIALTAMSRIPIAKNLQSKPEIAEIAALEIDDGEDVIEGAQLPVGEHAKTADTKPKDEVDEAIETINIEEEEPKSSKTAFSKSSVKVPDFSKFRKKLFLGGVAGVLLVAFLVWAFGYAPAATIIVTAKTSDAQVSKTLILGAPTTATDVTKDTVQTVAKQIKKEVSVEFTATGQKNVGDKATGTLTLYNYTSEGDSLSIAAGTIFTKDGYSFVTTQAVDVPATTYIHNYPVNVGNVNIDITAANPGTEYNLDEGDYNSSISGVTAYGTATSGGTTEMTTVVSAADIQKASQALADLSSESVKQQLIKQFTGGEFVIADSFNVDHAAGVSVPALGAEATGKAKLTSLTTFSMTAIARSELDAYLKYAIGKQIDDKNTQIVYKDGIDNAKLSGYLKTDQVATVNVNATGKIGPNIDKKSIKEQAKGKRYGDVQAIIESIKDVTNVDIKYSYFWVTAVPNDINKIDVQFVVQNV